MLGKIPETSFLKNILFFHYKSICSHLKKNIKKIENCMERNVSFLFYLPLPALPNTLCTQEKAMYIIYPFMYFLCICKQIKLILRFTFFKFNIWTFFFFFYFWIEIYDILFDGYVVFHCVAIYHNLFNQCRSFPLNIFSYKEI